MKTFQILVLTLLLVSIGGITNAKLVSYPKVATDIDFKKVIVKMMQDDFKRTDNYLNEFGITKLTDDVKIVFTVDSKNQIRILDGESKSSQGYPYVKQLLNNKSIDVAEELVGKKYSLSIALYYLAS